MESTEFERVPKRLYTPAKWATDTNREFDPTTEVHHFGFTVKIVDPGCTLEIQIEERSGQVTRLTTTESPERDKMAIRLAVNNALDRFISDWGL